MLTTIALVLVLALCNGFFALSEMALVASRKSRLKQLARTSRRARVALRHAEAPEHFLSTVQVGITLIMLITGAAAGDAVGDQLAELLRSEKIAWLAPYAHVVGIVIGFIIISFIQIVIGELVPKRLALAAPEQVSVIVGMPMLVLARVCSPFVWLLNQCSGALLRLMRVKARTDGASEEEIRLLVAESTEQGVLDADEQAMVNRVLRLGDRTVDSVMSPRTRIAWLDMNAPLAENLEVLRETPYSRYPVYRGDESDIAGVVEVKTLLATISIGQKPDLFRRLAKPLYVPGTSRALDLLEEFRDAETPMALVVDEYGDIDGVVTLNDLLAAVVGANQLGHRNNEEHKPIVQREDGSWLVDGALSTDDLRELLHLEKLPGEDEHDFRTAAGMVVSALGHIPVTGEVFAWHGIRFEVVDLDGARIDKLMVTPAPQIENADDEQ